MNIQKIQEQLSAIQENEWETLLAKKFSDLSAEELSGLKTLWMHGFAKGTETAVSILESAYNEHFNK